MQHLQKRWPSAHGYEQATNTEGLRNLFLLINKMVIGIAEINWERLISHQQVYAGTLISFRQTVFL